MGQTFTDQSIIQALQQPQQHRPAFEWLYQQVFPMVRKAVQQMGGNEDDARDMFQEGVLALWRNAQDGKLELRADTKLSTYLVTICKRRWLDVLKKASTRAEVMTEVLPEAGTERDILDQWVEQEEMAAFASRFGQLGQRCQDLLTRFYYQQQQLREISQALGIGESSAKNEKYRCMQRLKAIFASQPQQP